MCMNFDSISKSFVFIVRRKIFIFCLQNSSHEKNIEKHRKLFQITIGQGTNTLNKEKEKLRQQLNKKDIN